MIYLYLSIFAILLFFAGYFNGWMDFIKKLNLDSESWLNKWELDHDGKRIPVIYDWYYFGLFKTKYEEKFPYSSTILVFLTDQWHFKKWCMFLCIEFLFMLLLWHYEGFAWYFMPVGIILMKAIRGLGFTSKYDKK